MKNSKFYERKFKIIFFWCNKLTNSLWASTNNHDADIDKNLRYEVGNRIYEIKSLIKEYYSKKIGDAKIAELS